MQIFFFLNMQILFLYYEESVCPLLLNYNKVYFASSLIAKPSMHATSTISPVSDLKKSLGMNNLRNFLDSFGTILDNFRQFWIHVLRLLRSPSQGCGPHQQSLQFLQYQQSESNLKAVFEITLGIWVLYTQKYPENPGVIQM